MVFSISSLLTVFFSIPLSYFKFDLFSFVACIGSFLQLFLLLTDTTDMKLVEVFEVSVMHGHILHLETSPDEIIGCHPSCIVIVKEGTDMG